MHLEQVDENIWLAEGEIVSFHGFPFPTRCIIIRLPDGALWVWSPIALTDDLRREVDTLGPVAHLVSPNAIHHLYMGDWKEAYPQAALWGPPATIDKRTDLTFTGMLDDTAPPAWAGTIDQWNLQIGRKFSEVVFLHRPSRTAILTDTIEAFDKSFLRRYWSFWQRWVARLLGITEDPGRAPLDLRLLTLPRRAQVRSRVQDLIDSTPRRVIIAHGTWQRRDGAAWLARSFSWLGVTPPG
ncbi:DUF4336 domain-containing protein [Roseovarius sp. B08]|uniref:DUF4336 domain-containing protein n=1 Tax=Roseovarius sp. B08 TaxID=3449223 RepID=UPI003EDBD44E